MSSNRVNRFAVGGLMVIGFLSFFAVWGMKGRIQLKIGLDKVFECFCKVISTSTKSDCQQILDNLFLQKNYSISNISKFCEEDMPIMEGNNTFYLVLFSIVTVVFGILILGFTGAILKRACVKNKEFQPLLQPQFSSSQNDLEKALVTL